MLRRFGYGVPSAERALRSASNSLALVAEQEIQPFRYEPGGTRLNQAHFFAPPWPPETLLALGEHQVRLRVSLSYLDRKRVVCEQSVSERVDLVGSRIIKKK